ncbi:hypothetical protein [Sphingobium boeckii]|uniref:Uncharacterized protein n=1 Tax=Sphingobium boeckii TaxID=1082345 RepID=A0A7W9AHF3_9SPHN|nr:hypothetical protein [Sphingobium boeckii]MBB5685750.1 hypothetical protein [Sphingobium boeckii]
MTVRVFVGFFGLARALDRTIDSIEQHVFAPLLAENIEIVRAAHLNCPSVVHAPRSGETMVRYTRPDLSRLKLDALTLEEQSDERVADYIARIMKIPQYWEADEDGNMRRNVIHQMNSLKGLYTLLSGMDPQSFNAIILLRPDLRYIDPLPIRKFMAQIDPSVRLSTGKMHPLGQALRRGLRGPVDLITPDWHQWNGLNDRIAIATPQAAAAYLNRIDLLDDYAATHTHFQSEHLLKFAIERAGLKNAGTWVRANRVRTTGEEEGRDTDRKQPWLSAISRPIRIGLQI